MENTREELQKLEDKRKELGKQLQEIETSIESKKAAWVKNNDRHINCILGHIERIIRCGIRYDNILMLSDAEIVSLHDLLHVMETGKRLGKDQNG